MHSPLGNKGCLGRKWGQSGEGNLSLGHSRPSSFHQMSRQHIILGLDFRSYPTPSLTKKAWTWFCLQLAGKVHLLHGHCWSQMMLIMDFFGSNITQLENNPLHIALVSMTIKDLL